MGKDCCSEDLKMGPGMRGVSWELVVARWKGSEGCSEEDTCA